MAFRQGWFRSKTIIFQALSLAPQKHLHPFCKWQKCFISPKAFLTRWKCICRLRKFLLLILFRSHRAILLTRLIWWEPKMISIRIMNLSHCIVVSLLLMLTKARLLIYLKLLHADRKPGSADKKKHCSYVIHHLCRASIPALLYDFNSITFLIWAYSALATGPHLFRTDHGSG